MNENLIVLFTCHILGDFYLQSSRIAKEKASDFKIMLIHSSLYLIPFVFVAIFGTFNSLMDRAFFLFAIWLFHLIIDLVKVMVDRKFSFHNQESILYLLDQFAHLSILVILAEKVILFELAPNLYFSNEISRWILYLLLLGKPVNITFSILFSKYKPKQSESDSDESENSKAIEGAGKIIGSLERLLMAIMLGLNQFTAIGLVLTAKSIARYDKISKNPAFAEYFLIGTLFSTITAILLYILILG